MTVPEQRQARLTVQNYWRARNLQLRREMEILRQCVTQTQALQRQVIDASATAFTSADEWRKLLNTAKNQTRKARGQRTKVLKLVAADNDTIRIRPAHAEECSQDHKDLLIKARAYIDLIEAMGF